MNRTEIKQRIEEYVKIRDEYDKNIRIVSNRINQLKSQPGCHDRIRSLQDSLMDMNAHYGQVCQYIDRFREILYNSNELEDIVE